MPTFSAEYEKARQLYSEICQDLISYMPSDKYFEVMDKITRYGTHVSDDTAKVYKGMIDNLTGQSSRKKN